MENTMYDRIRERRIALELTQEELSEKVGYTSKTAITRIEQGKTDLGYSKIMAFSAALRCSPLWLMGFIDDSDSDIGIATKQNGMELDMADVGLKALGFARDCTGHSVDDYVIKSQSITLHVSKEEYQALQDELNGTVAEYLRKWAEMAMFGEKSNNLLPPPTKKSLISA